MARLDNRVNVVYNMKEQIHGKGKDMILLSCIVLLAAASAVGVTIAACLGGLWCIPLFLSCFAGGFVAYILLYLLVLLLVSLVFKRLTPKEKAHPILNLLITQTLRALCFLGRVKIRCEGKELLPKDGRFLFVSNHRSMFDPIITLVSLRESPMVFISKPENMKLPLVGGFIHYAGFLAIDRNNPRNAIRTVNTAAQRLADCPGLTAVGVYPEGTRNRAGQEPLLPFHDGVLMIAQKAKTPIVVASTVGTENITHNFPFRRTNVQLRILTVIPAEEVTETRVHPLSERVRDILLDALTAENKSFNRDV